MGDTIKPLVKFASLTNEEFRGAIKLEMAYAKENLNPVLGDVLEECLYRVQLLESMQSLGGEIQNLDAHFCEILRTRGKIMAIKEFRTQHGCSLLDAKNAIEALQKRFRVPVPR